MADSWFAPHLADGDGISSLFFSGNRPADDENCSVRGKSCRFRATVGANRRVIRYAGVIGQISPDCFCMNPVLRFRQKTRRKGFGADDAPIACRNAVGNCFVFFSAKRAVFFAPRTAIPSLYTTESRESTDGAKKKTIFGDAGQKNAKRRKKRLTEGDHARKRRHSLGRFAAFRIGS